MSSIFEKVATWNEERKEEGSHEVHNSRVCDTMSICRQSDLGLHLNNQ